MSVWRTCVWWYARGELSNDLVWQRCWSVRLCAGSFKDAFNLLNHEGANVCHDVTKVQADNGGAIIQCTVVGEDLKLVCPHELHQRLCGERAGGSVCLHGQK